MSVRREALILAAAGTGWQCPGCGAARAIHALLHGHVDTAIRINLLVVFSLPWMAIEIVQRIKYDAPMITARLSPSAIYGVAGVAVVFGVGRNLL